MKKLEQKIITLRTSFTIDEIVAKMLGWLRGHNFPANIEVTGPHFGESQLIRLSTLELSLEEHLSQLMNAAMEDYSACCDEVGYEIAIVKEEEIERIEALSKKALTYVVDLKHDIMKGRGSMLDADPDVTSPSGEICYTLKSADNWTKTRHGISIIDYVEPYVGKYEDTLVVERDGKGSKEGFSKTIVNNFYITFAPLIEAYIEAAPDHEERLAELLSRGLHWQTALEEAEMNKASLVVSSLGEYLSLRSRIPGGRKIGAGQSDEAIMTHIENAMAYKAKVWKERKKPAR